MTKKIVYTNPRQDEINARDNSRDGKPPQNAAAISGWTAQSHCPQPWMATEVSDDDYGPGRAVLTSGADASPQGTGTADPQ